MAKKTNKSLQVDKVPSKNLLGTPVMVANSGALWKCPKCGTERKRGMIFRYENADYCSRNCISA